MTDEWDDSPYAQYVGVGVDEDGSQPCDCPVGGCDHDSLTYRLSYWFWITFYRLKRRLGFRL